MRVLRPLPSSPGINSSLHIAVIVLFIGLAEIGHAQGIAISDDSTASAHASAMLDVSASGAAKGILIPRMTAAQRQGITAATGLLVYQTDAPVGFYYYDGSNWEHLGGGNFAGSGSAKAITFWSNTGNSLQSENNFVYDSSNIRVGIGTSSPEFRLTLDGDGGILAKGAQGTGETLLTSGAGTRLIWYPRKGAFRAGHVSGTQWDDANIGGFSFAGGLNVTASGNRATAFGSGSTASGNYSFATGLNSTASGSYAIAMGNSATASSDLAVSIGNQCVASGNGGVAIGYLCDATGSGSISIGSSADATANSANAFGAYVVASGSFSTAMGYGVSTNSKEGAFIVGDHSTSTTLNSASANQFTARFANGYYLYTNAATSNGVSIGAGGSSWSSVSDSTRKEYFYPHDGEVILSRFSALRLGSWNYKGQDPTQYRHYGPMAQEWFSAFGHDGVGTIGNDTTLASADVDGILCIAVQALEKRTRDLRETTENLRVTSALMDRQAKELTLLKSEVAEMKATQHRLLQVIERLEQRDQAEGRHASLTESNGR